MKFASSLALIAATFIASAQVSAADTTLAQALAANPDLSTLNTAVQASGLAETLGTAPGVTVFAPTNAAFASLPAGTLESLLKPESKADLEALLKRHVVGTAYDLDGLKRKRSVTALAGNELNPTLVRGKLRLGEEVKLATRALRVSNGYVIVIDRVLTP
jgi:uncharacterized surface protein with fasciclin (FAS1) repeats